MLGETGWAAPSAVHCARVPCAVWARETGHGALDALLQRGERGLFGLFEASAALWQLRQLEHLLLALVHVLDQLVNVLRTRILAEPLALRHPPVLLQTTPAPWSVRRH